MPPDRIHIIPNPVYVIPDAQERRRKSETAEHTIVAMGRLVHQKGFDLLLEAFKQCSSRFPHWSLAILGEGHERSALESLVTRLELHWRVRFAGLVENPPAVLRGADLFVMSSRFEGFPLALIEAMACGLPVISTDCPTGPSEIIRNHVDGILVPTGDAMKLADAMERLMAHPEERNGLAARAIGVYERFGIEAIMKLWDKLLADISALPDSSQVRDGSSLH